MNETDASPDAMAARREETTSALFASMVLQQTNMALMYLGKLPHPESGKAITDLEAARMFIDQMEMLEAKTKGNLTKQEDGLLKQSLAAVRMAFVEAVDQPGPAPAQAPQTETAATPGTAPESSASPAPDASASAGQSEARKKFTKKY
jgi:hypothetical protein